MSDPRVPHETFRLENGLDVVLIPDDALPKVVVDLWYDVGSYDDPTGRSGFAHLFEHLMFKGTAKVGEGGFDRAMEVVGGANNASTGDERTNYYDFGPAHAVELFLWLEADRMTGLEITQNKLDVEREVVRNERRQTSENTPYGKVELELPELLYPKEHPYHHPVIGSHEDLEAATVDDVKAFFASFYDPANASIVVAGDFDPAKAKETIDRMFGTIPSRGAAKDPGAPGFDDHKTTLTSVVKKTIEDEVELPKIVMSWQSPKHFGQGDAELDLLATALATGNASRLYKALVYDQKIAQSV